MKKLYTLISIMSLGLVVNAQIIYTNGPLVNSPGAGVGGADVSNLHDGLNTLGNNQNFVSGFWIADDFTVPVGETWNLDSVLIFGYQTNSGNISSMTGLYAYILDKSPDDPTAVVVAGDSTINGITETNWTGIYRTSETTVATSVARPIMVTSAGLSGSLTAGTYWLAWSQEGSVASGPWNPPLTEVNTITGNAKQFVLSSGLWQDVIDTATAGASDDAAQGMPFMLVGNIVITGVNSIANNVNISFQPNPVTTTATVIINTPTIDLIKNPATFIVTDILGKEVNRIQVTKSFTFDRSGLGNGIYLYKLVQGTTVLKQGKFNIN